MKAACPSLILPALNHLKDSLEYQALDGRHGENRDIHSRCQVDAKNDLEAIYSWLNEYREVPTTHRHYQKEAERLLLWRAPICWGCLNAHKVLQIRTSRFSFEALTSANVVSPVLF